MTALKSVTMGLLLIVSAFLAAPALAASTSELLQKGLYAEEVDGNIDAAIKTYAQIIQNKSASRNHVAQALYRQGMCYVKIGDESSAKSAFEKLVTDYADQAEIVEKARPLLDDLANFDPAALMPPDTLIYVELGSPGKQIETLLNMLKGTPFENPLAAFGGQQSGAQNQQSSANMMSALFNPGMMAEFKKIRGSAVGVTGIAQNHPPMVAVLYPGKSDALRGMILAGLGMVGQPGEPLDDMNTITIPPNTRVAYDDKVVIIAQPAEQLKWCVRQYKGLASEPTLASSNKSFAKINKKLRQSNALTAWANVDEVYTRLLKMFPPGQIPKEVLLVDAIADFNHIDSITLSDSIESDSLLDTLEIAFKDGHHCFAYDLIRTPNISRQALQAVPSNAVALASFALSPQNENQAQTIRAQLKNVTGLDIGREIFDNIEQVILFAVPTEKPTAFFPAYLGLVITSHNPQQTRDILTRILTTADIVVSQAPAEPTPGKYRIGMVKDTPLYCYVEQQGNATVISLNPDITKASVAAIKNNNSVCTAGPLNDAVVKMPASTSKLVAINAGGAIRLAAPAVIAAFEQGQQDALTGNFDKLALAADKTIVELRTDEQLNSFTLNRKVTGLPPLNQLFGPCNQIGQIIGKSKAETTSAKLRKEAPATILPAAKAPVIDGKPDDSWSSAGQYKITNVLYTPLSSPNDLAANYKAMWDQDNLYLLVDVTDEVLNNDSEENYQDDSVEVFIDADNSKAATYGEKDYAFQFSWDKTKPSIVEKAHNRTENVEYALVTTDNGYRIEAKFPWATLGTKPRTGSKIGLDVHVNDDDDGGDRDTKITWRDTKDDAWQNPQSFGNVELAGLIGWWKFDETEGKVAADSSGNGNNGSLVGNPVWRPQAGKIGGAIELDGKGSYVKIDNEPPFDITGQITISTWVNIKSIPQEWIGIVTKGDSAWRMSVEFAQNAFHFGLAREDYLNGRTNVSPGQWHHVLCVYDGQKMSTYVDGKLDTSRPRSGPIGTNDFPVAIGENLELNGRCWNGLIDDVRIYNYALSMNEITALSAGQ